MAIRYNTPRYKSWRNKVYARDHFHCRLCGKGGNLNAHHIVRKADDASLAFTTLNGISLCLICHHIVTGNEDLFAPLFKRIARGKLTPEFIYQFFFDLTQTRADIVKQLKKEKRWLLIPRTLTLSLYGQDKD